MQESPFGDKKTSVREKSSLKPKKKIINICLNGKLKRSCKLTGRRVRDFTVLHGEDLKVVLFASSNYYFVVRLFKLQNLKFSFDGLLVKIKFKTYGLAQRKIQLKQILSNVNITMRLKNERTVPQPFFNLITQ